MPRHRGQGRKAAITRQRYSNRASPVTIRRADGDQQLQQPLDASQLGRTVSDGNAAANPRPRSSRRRWSPPGR